MRVIHKATEDGGALVKACEGLSVINLEYDDNRPLHCAVCFLGDPFSGADPREQWFLAKASWDFFRERGGSMDQFWTGNGPDQ